MEQAILGVNRLPVGNRGQTAAPTDIFKAKDGHLITQVVGNGLFRRMAKAVGHSEWVDDPRFANDDLRGAERDEICDTVAAWVAQYTVDEALAILAEAGVPSGPVLDLDAALNHPQVQGMNLLPPMTLPGLSQPAPVARLPLDFSTFKPDQRRPPQTGAHNDDVLSEAGFARDQIDAFHQSCVI